MTTTTRTVEDMEMLFGRVANRIVLNLCPVELDDPARNPGSHGGCSRDCIYIKPGKTMPERLYVLLHEAAHIVMHRRPGDSVVTLSYRQTWEFEAHQVAKVLYERFGGFPRRSIVDDRYDMAEVLALHPIEYYQRRIDQAVERIWKIVGE